MIRYYQTSVGKKAVMAATGLGLGLFLVLHAAGNGFAYVGRRAYLAYADRLHGLGPLLVPVRFLFVACLALHVFTGLQLFTGNRRSRPQGYAVGIMRSDARLAARLMPYTGAALLAFLAAHLPLFAMGDRPPVADLVRTVLGRPGWAAVHLAGALAAAAHLWHGGWSLFQSLGLSHPTYDTFVVRSAAAIAAAVGLLLGLLPLAVLLVRGFLQ